MAMENGYQLVTDSLGGHPVLRRLNDDEVLRPASANRNTVKALEERGLISRGKGRDPLTIGWHIKGEEQEIGHLVLCQPADAFTGHKSAHNSHNSSRLIARVGNLLGADSQPSFV
jgi:hypothetical protein